MTTLFLLKPLRATAALVIISGALAGCGGGGSNTSTTAGLGEVTQPPAVVNAAPTQVGLLAITSQDSTSLTAAWLPALDDSTPAALIKYQVHAGTDAAFVPSASTLKFSGTGVNSAQITGLTAGATYQLKLVATDAAGASTSSNAMPGKTAEFVSQRVATTSVIAAPTATAQQPTITPNSLTFPAQTVATAKVGDILVGGSGDGYLRKVQRVTTVAGSTQLDTAPTSLNQVFSTLELSSTVKLQAASAQTIASKAAKLSQPSSQASDAEQSVADWPAAGLSITTSLPSASASAQERKRPLALRASETATLADGTYGWVTGPTSVALDAGDSVEIPFSIRSRTPEVKICKIEYLDATPHSGGSDPGGLVALGSATVTSALPSGASTWTTQNFKITPTTKAVLATDFYVVRARVTLDDANDDCASWHFLGHKEKIDFSFNLAVTKPGESLPPSFASKVKWTGDFSVDNDINLYFDPIIESTLKISGAKLQSASSKVSGAMGIKQILTIDANVAGKLIADTKVIVPERSFRKVFLVGEIPVIITGTFKLSGRLEGDVSGKMNVVQSFDYGFPNFELGVQYSNGVWTTVKETKPEYHLVIKGSGESQANLTVTLIPEFKISAYESATGRLTLEPYVKAAAAIEGHFLFEDKSGNLQGDADYRFTKLDVIGGTKAYLMADFTIWDYTLAAWPSKAAKPDDISTWQKYEPIAPTKILGLPELSAKVNLAQSLPADAKTALITVTATEVPNPLNFVNQAPLVPFANWLPAYAVLPQNGFVVNSVETDKSTGALKVWASYRVAGAYKIRVPAQSNLRLRQYLDIDVIIPDVNNDGIADSWAEHFKIASASDDPNHDGRNNLIEFQENTDPNAVGTRPSIGLSSPVLTVSQQFFAFIENAYAAAKSVIWDLGNGVNSAATAISVRFAAIFDSVGSKTITATLLDTAAKVIGVVQRVVDVQLSTATTVTSVTPATTPVLIGTPQTFIVVGTNMTEGLGFALQDCGNVSEVLVGATAIQRQFTCTFPAGTTPEEKYGTVSAKGTGGNPFGAVLLPFKVTATAAPNTLGPISPLSTIRTLGTSFDFTGQNLPTSGITVVPLGNAKSNCQPAFNLKTTGFSVACELFNVGSNTLEVRSAGGVLGTATVNVLSNVTGVTWTSPSTTSSGTVKFGETVVFTVAGENLLADPQMGFAVEKCGVSNAEVGPGTATARVFRCLFNNEAGAVAGQMPGVVKDAPSGQVLFDGWKVPVEVPPLVCTPPQVAVSGVCVAPPGSTSVFYEDFNTAKADGTIGGANGGVWTRYAVTGGVCGSPPSNVNNIVLSGGLITFGNCNHIETTGTKTFTGSKFVIEGRFAGTAAGRNTYIALIDVDKPANQIYIGDTNYSATAVPGVYVYQNGDATMDARGLMPSTAAFKEYRITIDGSSVVIERGESLANLSERVSTTLKGTVSGRKFALRIGTAGAPYFPGIFDWVRVINTAGAPEGTIIVPVASFLPSSVNVAASSPNLFIPCAAGLLYNAPPYIARANSAEWSVPIPVAGKYRIEVEYAALQSRPVDALIDGVLINSNVLADTTGSWCATPSITRTVGAVSLTAGDHVFRLQRGDVFPHIKEIRFIPFVLDYSKISTSGFILPDDTTNRGYALNEWACTRNNLTGTIYELKMEAGPRSQSIQYTNFSSTAGLQNIDRDGNSVPATQADINASSNSVGFMKNLNLQNLCGRNDWRVPNKSEAAFYPLYSANASIFFPDVVYRGGVSDGVPWQTYDGANFWVSDEISFKGVNNFAYYSYITRLGYSSVGLIFFDQVRSRTYFVRGVSGG